MNVAGVTSAVLLTGAIAWACGGRDDKRDNVKKALDEANIPNVAVDVDDTANLVHLKGTVGSTSDRTRAGEVASAAVGTSGRVLNELAVQGIDTPRGNAADVEVQDVLDRIVDNDPVLRERDINFEVLDGVVTVKGEVRTPGEKNRVTEIVRKAPGVKGFANDLEIHAEQ